MRGKFGMALCFAIALLLGITAFGSAQDLTATEFRSNGDLNSGWYWLRDQALQQVAEWTFEGIPAGAEDLTLEITALATDCAGGGKGFSAQFKLIYGFPGSGMMGGVFDTKMVTLPNVSPPNDPLGYTCRGVVTISRSAFPAASTLVFRVERTSPDANHIAFNRDSIAILAPGAEHETEEQNDAGSGHDASDERKGALPLLPGTYQGFLKDNDDYDWYSFNADKGQIISLGLELSSTSRFELRLYDPDASSKGSAYASNGNPAKIDYVAGEDGIWFIRIRGHSGEGNYTLQFSTTNQDDAASGSDAGDNPDGALPLLPGTYQGFLEDDDDDDWYSFNADKGQIISLGLELSSTSRFELRLYDPDASSKGSAYADKGNPAKIDYVAGEDGTWFIRIRRHLGEGNYTLQFSTTNQNDAASGNDAGDDPDGALPLLPGTYQGFLKDDDDDDWYSFNADKGQTICLGFELSSTSRFELRLYDPDVSSRGSAYADNGNPAKIDYVAGEDGTWFIRIRRYSGEGNYTLTVGAPSYQATEFNSNGDLIDSWSWLRDDALQQSAEWTFEGLASAAPVLTVEITLLASGIAAGQNEVHFLFVIGPPGAATFWSQEVSLPVVGPAAGAAEFRCRGIVQIPRLLQYGTDQLNLIFRVRRISSSTPRIAFQEDSVIVQIVQEETALEADLRTVTADGFESNGDSILGIEWCRQNGHFLEWIWEPINDPRAIPEAAVNFELLVTNKANGGSGFGTTVLVRVFNSSGIEVESGPVELVNPFRPQFPEDSGGIGYKAYGVYELSSPELVRGGFQIRLEWPPVDNTYHHIGGDKDRAVLAMVLAPQDIAATTLEMVRAGDVLMNPLTYEGQTIQLEGEFHGWEGALTSCPPPVSRSDWLVGEAGAYLYATGPFPEGLHPMATEDCGKRVVVVGTIQLAMDPTFGPCPYIEVESARTLEPGSTAEGMPLPTQCFTDIPIYPGATWEAAIEAQISQFIQALGGSSMPSGEARACVSSDSPAEVVAFYRQVVPEMGWKESLMLPSEKGIIVIWEKGELSLQLVVTTYQGKTIIILGCGEKLG